jgi:hypothetical protein
VPEDEPLSVDNRRVIPSTDLISGLSLRRRQQVRVQRPGESATGDFIGGLYSTEQEVGFNDSAERTLWMNAEAMDRINAGAGWRVALNPQAPHREYDSDRDAKAESEFIEQSISDGNRILVCAPHGGDMHEYTDDQAKRIAGELGESAWVCLGYNKGGGAVDRWWVDQTRTHPASFPRLSGLVGYDGTSGQDRFYQYDRKYSYGLTFQHNEQPGVIVGGLAPESTKQTIRANIDSYLSDGAGPVRVARTGRYGGTDTKELANRISEDGNNGIIIAQSKNVRQNHWLDVADSLIDAFGG